MKAFHMKILRLLCILAVVFTSCALKKEKYVVTHTTMTGTISLPDTSGGATDQPEDERKAQEALPKSKDKVWEDLSHTKVKLDEKTGLFNMQYSDSVKALEGKSMAVTGFMMPLEGGEEQKHFLLCKRTPTCPFCMPGGPTEVIEINSDTPVKWVDDMVRIEGALKLLPANDNGMLYQLNGAKAVPIAP